jgi:hypothetical protein
MLGSELFQRETQPSSLGLFGFFPLPSGSWCPAESSTKVRKRPTVLSYVSRRKSLTVAWTTTTPASYGTTESGFSIKAGS